MKINPEDIILSLIENGYQWVVSQRDMHQPSARTLSELERSEFARFLEAGTLNRARVKFVPGIENPEFYTNLRNMGITNLLDFSDMSGITFDDTILISQLKVPAKPLPLPLLFHELVHVVQYEILGLRTFVERYVIGWAENEFEYLAIPLERDAYDLEARYKTNPHLGFSVTAEVRHRLER